MDAICWRWFFIVLLQVSWFSLKAPGSGDPMEHAGFSKTQAQNFWCRMVPWRSTSRTNRSGLLSSPRLLSSQHLPSPSLPLSLCLSSPLLPPLSIPHSSLPLSLFPLTVHPPPSLLLLSPSLSFCVSSPPHSIPPVSPLYTSCLLLPPLRLSPAHCLL